MLVIDKLKDFLPRIQPKVYKKKLFIGKKPILTLTYQGIQKILFKFIWIIVVITIILMMVFGGLVMFVQTTPSVPTDRQIFLP